MTKNAISSNVVFTMTKACAQSGSVLRNNNFEKQLPVFSAHQHLEAFSK
jgi:hypothetical protein